MALCITSLATARSAVAQIDSEAGRNARALIAQIRSLYSTDPNWRTWKRQVQLEDVDLALVEADRADETLLGAAANYCRSPNAALNGPLFVRLGDALYRRADEMALVPPVLWPQECGQQQLKPRRSAQDVAAARALARFHLAKLDALLSPLGPQQRSWREFLLWPQTQALLSQEIPDPALLDSVDTRWANAPLAWRSAELTEAALAFRVFARMVRGAYQDPTGAERAAAWNELAIRLSGPPGDADYDPERVAALVAGRERAGEASRLTRSIRRAIAQPNVRLRVGAQTLASQLTARIDEPFQTQANYVGALTNTTGRLVGNTAYELVPSKYHGEFLLTLWATSTGQSSGGSGFVTVDSHATTQIAGSQRYHLDPRDLRAGPAVASARTAIVYDRVVANTGPRRRAEAEQQAYAQIPQAEREGAQTAEQATTARLNAMAATRLAQFNQWYWKNIRDPMLRSPAAAVRPRIHSDRDALYYECNVDRRGTFAVQPPPVIELTGEIVTQCTAQAVEDLIAGAWGGRTWQGDEIRATFAPQPCRLEFFTGGVRANVSLTSLKTEEAAYPAMTVRAEYRLEPRPAGPVLVRQAALGVELNLAPTDSDGSASGTSGRQQVLQLGLRRKLNKLLSAELTWPDPQAKRPATNAPSFRPQQVSLSANWLQIVWASATQR